MTVPRLIFVFGFILLFAGTARETGVTGKDEFWVTMRTPLEMIERDSYWTLWLNDEVRLKKPPLVYWTIAGFYQLFGVHLWAARLVGVLSGAGMAALTAMLYKRLFHRSGFLAGITVLATAGVAVEGRRAMLDMPMGFFCLGSVYLALAAKQDGKRWLWAASGAALAAATLAKGPQSLLFVVPALALGWALTGDRPSPRRLWISAALFAITFLALALPWPLSMRILHADFIAELQTQIVDNRLNKVDLGSPFNALGGALLLAFPWSFVMVVGIVRAFGRHPRFGSDPRVKWLTGWLLLSILPFFFMRAFERYMIPILPCASLLILRTLETSGFRTRKILLILSTSLLALVTTVFGLFGLWFNLAFIPVIMCMAMTLWMVWSAFQAEPLERPLIAAAWLFMFLLGVLYPRFGVNRIPDALPWEELREHPVGVYSKYSQPSMLSMRLGRSVDLIREDRLVARGYDGYIFTTADQFRDPDPSDDKVAYLDHALRSAGVPFEEAGRYGIFFSRRNWIKFTRPDASFEDWMDALRSRDLSGLKSGVVWVRTGDFASKPRK